MSPDDPGSGQMGDACCATEDCSEGGKYLLKMHLLWLSVKLFVMYLSSERNTASIVSLIL